MATTTSLRRATLAACFSLAVAGCTTANSDAENSSGGEPAEPKGVLYESADDIDGQEGLEQIWIDADHVLHAGSLATSVEVPAAEPGFIDDQVSLSAIEMHGSSLVVFIHPMEGAEDPPNLYQVYAVGSDGLSLVYKDWFEEYAPLEVLGSGASYTESPSKACDRLPPGDSQRVMVHPVILDTEGSGPWSEAERVDTGEVYDCATLPG